MEGFNQVLGLTYGACKTRAEVRLLDLETSVSLKGIISSLKCVRRGHFHRVDFRFRLEYKAQALV